MFKNSIKKSTITLLAVALIGVTVAPIMAYAKNYHYNFSSLEDGITSLFNKAEQEGNSNESFGITGGGIFNNSSLKDARKAYNKAIQQADKTYSNARKTARTNFNAALKSAGNDSTKRLVAYKTYMSDLLVAFKQRSVDKEAAMQAYIDALSNIQVNQAPTANAQSVTVTKNTSRVITLTGSDPENSPLSFFIVTNPTNGTLSGTVPNPTYLPNTNFTGSDSFTFKVNDGSLDSIPASILITVSPSI